MKKQNPYYIIQVQIRQSRAVKRSLRRKDYLLQKRTGRKLLTQPKVNPVASSSLKRMDCPKNLSITTNTTETITFLESLNKGNVTQNRKRRRKPKKQKFKSFFDFTKVEHVCPATALILCSIYDVALMRGGKFAVFDFDDWAQEVQEVFLKIGFFNWLKVSGVETTHIDQQLPIQSFQSRTEANGEVTGTYLEQIVRSFNEARSSAHVSEMSPERLKNVASAILEAVENSVRHAYTNSTPKDLKRKWWIGGISSPEEGEITLICYDAGMSIPESIANSKLDDPHGVRKHVRRIVSRFQSKTNSLEANGNLDHKRLEVAMRYLKSSTMQKGSGKGLSHIASTIDVFTGGEVEIFSRRAHYLVKKNQRPISKLLTSPLPGTLIIWRIRL